jgi:hypothetical protein
MISDTNSNGVLTRKEREELVLDLYFKENKTYHEIAKIARMSHRDIKPHYRQDIPGKRENRA